MTLHRAKDVKNSESLGLGMLGKGIAKLANLKPDPYVNILLGGMCSLQVHMISSFSQTPNPVSPDPINETINAAHFRGEASDHVDGG